MHLIPWTLHSGSEQVLPLGAISRIQQKDVICLRAGVSRFAASTVMNGMTARIC